ncbi:ISAs1 family transposase [Lachnospiraceae bacterium OttesenSCG-928-D06]|nr:ISAs1 family transposase [Lachnospiraceae bacterium OttesenSCG-928-D06]
MSQVFVCRRKRVNDKSNEITAIPELLNGLNLKGTIITIDAMGTQTEITKRIRSKGADYVLSLKGNQTSLHDDVRLYLEDTTLLKQCAYTKTMEKARSGIEKREYWQTEDINWMSQKKNWAGIRTIAMTCNTIMKDGKETLETRYFISSLALDVTGIAKAIRGHWMVESYPWHLDVTFHEDGNYTLEKQAAYNLNIMRKLALHVLKLYEAGHKPMSLKKKRFAICTNSTKHIQAIFAL